MEKDHPKKADLHSKPIPTKAPSKKEKEKPTNNALQTKNVKKEKETHLEVQEKGEAEKVEKRVKTHENLGSKKEKEKPVDQGKQAKKEKEVHLAKIEKGESEPAQKRVKTHEEFGSKKEKNKNQVTKKLHEEAAEEKNKKEEEKNKKKDERQAQLKQWAKIRSQIIGTEEQLSSGFLEKMFEELEKQKQTKHSQEIPKNTVYKGFKTIPIQKLSPRKMYKDPPLNGKKEIWNKDQVLYYKESCPLSFKQSNGFFKAFYQAYIHHGDLKLTPDDVWMTIMLFFSKYVDKNEKTLRKAFVQHEGKMELQIKIAGEIDDWAQFLQKVIIEIKKITVKGSTENLECNFSSTDKFSSFLSTIMIMNTYKRYISYNAGGGICGIQNIHMGGELEDWENLEKKLYFLRQYDVDGNLKQYVDRLLPVLKQFTQTYKGNGSEYFWNNLYHNRPPNQKQYGASSKVNGWLIRFFTVKEEIQREVKIEQVCVPVYKTDPKLLRKTYLHLVGGCLGVSVEDQNVYRPHFSFAVVKKTEKVKK